MLAALAPAIGSVVGGLLSKKGDKQSQTTGPVIPDWLDTELKDYVNRNVALSKTPYPAPLMRRVQAPQGWMDSQQVYDAQVALDRKNWEAAMNPAAAAPAQNPAMAGAQNGRNFIQDMINGNSPMTGMLSNYGGTLRTQLPGLLSRAKPETLDLFGQVAGMSEADLVKDYYGQGGDKYARAMMSLLGK